MATDGDVDGVVVCCTSDGVQEFICGTCNQDNRATEASHYCPSCDQCYCRTCLCDHDVIGRSGLHRWGKHSSQKEDLNKEGMEMCLRHPEYESSLYCVDDDVLCCKICRTAEHRTCKKMQPIKDAVDKEDLEIDVRKIKSDIDNIKRQISFISYDSKFRERNAVQSHSEYTEQVREIRKDIIDIMDKIEANANTYLNHLREKFETDRHFCEKMLHDIQGIESKIEMPANDRMRQFIQVKKSREVIGGLFNTVSSIREADLREIFLLKSPEIVDSILTEIKDMGELVMGVSQRKYDCEIGSACQIENGDLLVVDVANKAVLQVDDTLNITRTLKFDQTPKTVCSAGENSIALPFGDGTVQFISAGDCEETTEIIKLQEAINHLTVHDNKIYIAYKNACVNYKNRCFHYIYIKCFSKKGDELFCKHIDVGGYHIYSLEFQPLIAHGQKLFLWNDFFNTLYTCDTEGNKLASVQLGSKISDLAVDDLGSVYAGGNDGEIYKIADTGEEIKKQFSVQTLGISLPRVLCWDRRNGRLMLRCKEGNTLYWI